MQKNNLYKIYGLELKFWAKLIPLHFIFKGVILLEGLVPTRMISFCGISERYFDIFMPFFE